MADARTLRLDAVFDQLIGDIRFPDIDALMLIDYDDCIDEALNLRSFRPETVCVQLAVCLAVRERCA